MVRSHHSANLIRPLVVVFLVAALGLLCSGCHEDDVEEQLGRMSAASVEAAYDVDTDPLICEWINNAGQTLVSHSRRQHIPYEFKVIDTDMVNAFAAPYGHIYVTQGFLDFAESEDEIWVVLGHEIGHVVNRDSIKSFKRSLLMNIIAAVIRSESNALGDAVGLGFGLLSLRYSRKDEYDADDSGTFLSYRAGYDPNANIAFFTRLMTDVEKRKPGSWEVYFMTHPPTERRIGRQERRPELDPENVEALTHIGRGYSRRAQYSQAIRYLTKAAELDPKAPDLEIALGDAYAARGEFDKAAERYSAALELTPDDSYAKMQLAAVEANQPYQAPGIAEAGREHATELLAQTHELESTAAVTMATAATQGAAVSTDMTDLVAMVKGMNRRLMSLADERTEVSEALQQLIVRGNAAIARANDSVYMLERVNQHLGEAGSEIKSLLETTEAQLADAEAGHGDPSDLRVMRNAITELRRAVGTVELATGETPKTLTAVRGAQLAAEKTTTLLEGLVRDPRRRRMFADDLRLSATRTSRQAINALHAANRARRMSIKARSHALLARMNLLGIGASPELQAVYDKQVSHYLLCPTAEVRAMRNEGLGYGEAAVCIAAAKSLGTRPGRFIVQEGRSVSPVGSALREGAALSNANVLMKFLATAMEQEREAFEVEPAA